MNGGMEACKRKKSSSLAADPCGLAAAVEFKNRGLNPLIIEKENIVHSISQYPTYLEFFSSPQMLEIADIPFTTANEKPSRLEALNYYRTVSLRSGVRVNAYEKVTEVKPAVARLFSPNGEPLWGNARVQGQSRRHCYRLF